MKQPTTITAWSDAEGPAMLVQRLDDGQVMVSVLDSDGDMAVISIPSEAWFAMARQMYQHRSWLAAMAEVGTRH